MIICLGTDAETLQSPIAKRFGNAPYFLFYNTEDQTVAPLKNEREKGCHEHKEHHKHHEDCHKKIGHKDHEHKHLSRLAEVGAEVIIVGNIGPNAFKELKAEGVKVFLARKRTAEEALRDLKEGKLEELLEPTAPRSIRKK